MEYWKAYSVSVVFYDFSATMKYEFHESIPLIELDKQVEIFTKNIFERFISWFPDQRFNSLGSFIREHKN